MPFCPKRGKQVEENALFCPNCGAALTQQQQPAQPAQPTVPPYVPPRPVVGTKNEGLAVVLSVIWPGLDHVYVCRIG